MKVWRKVTRGDFSPPSRAHELISRSERDYLLTILGLVTHDMRKAVRVDVSNVLSYLIDDDAMGKGYGPDDVAEALPPWGEAWLEGSVQVRTADNQPLRLQVGCWVSSGPEEAWRGGRIPFDPAPQPGQYGVMTMVWSLREDRVSAYGPTYHAWIILEPDGTVARRDGNLAIRFLLADDLTETIASLSPAQYERHVFTAHTIGLVMPLFTFAFANCRNVSLVEEQETYPSRQVRRAAERLGETPLRFYTLQIDPSLSRKASASRDRSPGDRQKALHICRGHFATYTAERPLFGKHVGRFWIPAHVRGTAEAGVVAKDYAVMTP